MTEEIKKNKGGRPVGGRSKYKKHFPDLAFETLKKGGLKCHVAAAFGVHHETLDIWLRDPKKPLLRDAFNRGMALSEAFHANRLMDIATSGKGNVSAQLRIMEWGFKWKNITTVEDLTVEKKMTDDDLDRRIAELTKSNNVVSIKKQG
jgi:hypothetical protein